MAATYDTPPGPSATNQIAFTPEAIARAQFALPGGSTPYVSGIASLTRGGVSILAFQDHLRVNTNIVLPPLWAGGLGHMEHLPLLIKANLGPAQRVATADAIAAAFYRSASPGIRSSTALTASTPIASSSIVPDGVSVVPPIWSADPSLIPGPLKMPLVIVGVIDDSIAFAHRNFNNSSKTSTRMEFCWLQGGIPESVPSVAYGRELTRNQINVLKNQYGGDEDLLYHTESVQASDLPNPMHRFGSHGAHVADLAAGSQTAEISEGVPIDHVRVIGVQLPTPVTNDTTGYSHGASVLAAIHYIFNRADLIATAYGRSAEPIPIILNFSYGYTGGPHDGSDTLNQAVKQLIDTRNAITPIKSHPHTLLVVPSGNSFHDRLIAQVASSHFNKGKLIRPLYWRIPPADRTPNYLECWFDANEDMSKIGMSLKAPDGAVALAINPGGMATTAWPQAIVNSSGGNVGIAMYAVSGGRPNLTLCLWGTEPSGSVGPTPGAGVWNLEFEMAKKAALQGVIDVRIQRDNNIFGYERGARQSYLDDPLVARYDYDGLPLSLDEPVQMQRHFGSISNLACNDVAIVVAGMRAPANDVVQLTLPLQAAPYSAAGTVPASVNVLPFDHVECAAVADSMPALRGRRSAGTRSGSSFRMDGTSVAAPQIARKLAAALLTREVNESNGIQSNPIKPPPNQGIGDIPSNELDDIGSVLPDPNDPAKSLRNLARLGMLKAGPKKLYNFPVGQAILGKLPIHAIAAKRDAKAGASGKASPKRTAAVKKPNKDAG